MRFEGGGSGCWINIKASNKHFDGPRKQMEREK